MKQHWAWSAAWSAARCGFLISPSHEAAWHVSLPLPSVYPEFSCVCLFVWVCSGRTVSGAELMCCAGVS